MRRNGKTTRTIDEAIQKLFIDGEIIIPTKVQIEYYTSHILEDKRWNNDKITEYENKAVIDSDWSLGYAQDDFRRRILKRLEFEHRDMFKTLKDDNSFFKIIKE